MRAKSEASSFSSRPDGLFKVEEVPFVLPRESQQGTRNEKMHSVIPEALLSFSISFFLTFFFFYSDFRTSKARQLFCTTSARGISAFDVILGIRSVIHLLYNQMHTHQPDRGF